MSKADLTRGLVLGKKEILVYLSNNQKINFNPQKEYVLRLEYREGFVIIDFIYPENYTIKSSTVLPSREIVEIKTVNESSQ